MRYICSWCKKEIKGSSDSSVDDDKSNEVSHGICEECSDNLLFQRGVDLMEYIDSLPVPVVAITSDGLIRNANKSTLKYLEKEILQIRDKKGGDIFECVNARLPEGCGNTMHCTGCTIRRSVMKTHETGISIHKVPAYLKRRRAGGGERKTAFYISTIKYREFVLLRIEEKKD